ncbi:MAG: hypothetical protein HFE99_01485 [Ruminiclostridium sp.]|nr:hypothetical protein [Ruminiclostridium sp.]
MKRSYFDQLSRAAHWRLPPAEAKEVLEDYQALLADDPRSEEALRREVGEPVAAVRQLEQGNHYRHWLVAFVLMAACLLLPALSILLNQLSSLGILLSQPMDSLWNGLSSYGWAMERHLGFLLLLGLGLALWVRRQGVREGPLPKGILPLLLVQFTGIVAFWLLFWQIATILSGSWLTTVSFEQASILQIVLCVWGFLLALLGLPALVRFRLSDRRWLSVYMLGLTVSVLGMAVMSLLFSMNLEVSASDWWKPALEEYLMITLLGLVGTGAALC